MGIMGNLKNWFLTFGLIDNATPKARQISNEMQNLFSGIGLAATAAGEKTANLNPVMGRLGASVSMASMQLASLGAVSTGVGRAVNQLGTGVAMLMTTGFNPLSIAIAGVTAVLGYFVGAMSEANKEMEKHRAAVKEEQDRAAALAKEYTRIAYELAGYTEKEQELDQVLKQKNLILDDIEKKQKRIDYLNELGKDSTNDVTYALMFEKEELGLLNERLGVAEGHYQELIRLAGEELRRALFKSADSMKAVAAALAKQISDSRKKAAEDAAKEKPVAPGLMPEQKKGPTSFADVMKESLAFDEAMAEQQRIAQEYVQDILQQSIDARIAAEQEAYNRKIGVYATGEEIVTGLMIKANEERLRELQAYYGEVEGQRQKDLEDRVKSLDEYASRFALAEELFMGMGEVVGEGTKLATAMQVGAIVARTAVRSLEEVAEATAALAAYNYPAAALHFTAAGLFAAIGTAQAVKTAMGGGGGGVRGGGMTGGRTFVREQRQEEQQPSRYTIAIYGAAYFGSEADKEITQTVERYNRRQRPGAMTKRF